MTTYLIRIFIFTILPLLVGAVMISLDPLVKTRSQRLEVYLIYMLGLGVAGSGIGGFVGHLFLSDIVAESVGWPVGSPFQLEMGFANLALGVLGLIAVARRDGFREATATAVVVLGVGASIVHFIDIIQTGNLAPGNTIQNIGNLVRPALLVALLVASRRAGAEMTDSEAEPAVWAAHIQSAGWLTAIVSTGFGVGFAVSQPSLVTLMAILVGGAFAALTITRTRSTNPRQPESNPDYF